VDVDFRTCKIADVAFNVLKIQFKSHTNAA